MSPLWQDAPITAVRTEEGRPVAFSWRGQEHRVTGRPMPWRVATRWWDQPVNRAYWRVATDTGWLVVLYREGDAWHLERVYE